MGVYLSVREETMTRLMSFSLLAAELAGCTSGVFALEFEPHVADPLTRGPDRDLHSITL